jgi:hypothetical protein
MAAKLPAGKNIKVAPLRGETSRAVPRERLAPLPGEKPRLITSWQDQLTDPTKRNAYAALEALFRSYGLESLAPKILEYVKQGDDAATVQLRLQETQEWKQRFAGNEKRRAAGLNVYSVGDYLAMENSYRATMKAYGLPSTFYDSPDDYANLMANDVSPEEVKTRAAAAWDFTQQTNVANRQMLKDYYGVDESHIAAYFLDPTKGQALIERQVAAAGYGGIAARQNLKVEKNKAESWIDQGISASQVATGVETAANVSSDLSRIGKRYGEDYSSSDALDEFVGGLASSRRKRESISRKETATFGGSTGTASFGGRDTGGF